MKQDKKGFFLAEETLKIVISVIVIIFLIYFLASLYFSGKDSEELKFAEDSLNYLIGQLNLKAAEIQIYNPKDWVIISWKRGEKMPLQCSNLKWENCVCLCKDAEKCDEDGICSDYGKEIFIKDRSLEIDNPPITLKINYEDRIQINKK